MTSRVARMRTLSREQRMTDINGRLSQGQQNRQVTQQFPVVTPQIVSPPPPPMINIEDDDDDDDDVVESTASAFARVCSLLFSSHGVLCTSLLILFHSCARLKTVLRAHAEDP